MKHFVFLFVALLLGAGSSRAEASENKVAATALNGYSNSFIFLENGITFAVYPDGEFDFYIDNQVQVQAGVRVGAAAVTFNSGFNYNPFVQYDDYGAVIQVENVPVYYDYYGRVNMIGNVRISYRNGLVYRLGGMRVFYNSMGGYAYHTGFINPFNRVYVYRPFHRFFIRPAVGFCMVFRHPYRRYYRPVRYTYYRPYHNNFRRAYARVGKSYRYQARTERNRIYQNDRRVATRQPVRSNRTYAAEATGRSRSPVRTARVADAGRNRVAGRTQAVARTERSSNRSARVARNSRSRVESPKQAVRTRSNSTRTVQAKQAQRSTNRAANRSLRKSTPSKRTSARTLKPASRSPRTQAVSRSTGRKPAKATSRSRRQ